MSVLVVGLNHRTAPTALLERASVVGDDLTKVLHRIQQADHVAEALVLSTCNRVEVYAEVTGFHGGVDEVSGLISDTAGVDVEALTPHLYVHHDARAVQHLFSVACGLDSMLVGEPQILGQLRGAFNLARSEGLAGRVLTELLSNAMRVGKRAHSETGIDRVGASLVQVGLDLAAERLGSLEGLRALVVGAGSTGALAAATLRRTGAGEIVVANRSAESGGRLAESVAGRATGLDALADEIAAADLVVCTTGASSHVVSRADVEVALSARAGRPLVFLDLAMPRDVEAGVAELHAVTVIDLESLRAALEEEQAGEEVERVRAIVSGEVADFLAWQRANAVAPTVVALRTKADVVLRDELERLWPKLPRLDDAERAEVEQAARRVVEKILHAPTVRMKELAASPGGVKYADALRELFELGRAAAEAVSAPDPREVP